MKIDKWSPVRGCSLRSEATPDAVDAQEVLISRRSGPLALLTPPTAPPLTLGLMVVASLVAGETLILYPLKILAPEDTLGIVYALGVVIVAIVWGFWLAAATSLVSVLAFDFFHIPPIFALTLTSTGDVVAFTTCLVLAMLASTVSQRARADVAEAYQRRREFERFFNLSSDLMAIRGTAGYFKHVNPAFEQTLGHSRARNYSSAGFATSSIPRAKARQTCSTSLDPTFRSRLINAFRDWR